LIANLVLFGASGDLAERFLLLALATLRALGRLPEDFSIVCTARPRWDDEAFRRHVTEQLAQHAARAPQGTVTR
jgi:glucose-6-phosphate 1-dehydrogenase